MSNWYINIQHKGYTVRLQSYGPWGRRNTLTWVTEDGCEDSEVTGGNVWRNYFRTSQEALAWIDAQVEGNPED